MRCAPWCGGCKGLFLYRWICTPWRRGPSCPGLHLWTCATWWRGCAPNCGCTWRASGCGSPWCPNARRGRSGCWANAVCWTPCFPICSKTRPRPRRMAGRSVSPCAGRTTSPWPFCATLARCRKPCASAFSKSTPPGASPMERGWAPIPRG